MLKYSIKRLLLSLVTLTVIIVIVFSLTRMMPVEGYFQNFDKMDKSEIQAALKSMGLLDPLYLQICHFFVGLFHGSLGNSEIYRPNVPVIDIIAQKAPVSICMGLASMIIALLLGIPLGTAMARSKGHFWDKFGTVFIVIIMAVPAAVYYLYIQLYGTDLFGLSLLFDLSDPTSWILPTLSLSLGDIAYYAMWLRRFMVDEQNKDYVKLATAKGVSSKNIMKHHVFWNAFVPLVQYLPSSLLYTISGSIYIESLYSVPGMGGLLVDVIQRQDNNMVQALVLLYSAIGIVGLLLGDLLMHAMDPRINLTKKEGSR